MVAVSRPGRRSSERGGHQRSSLPAARPRQGPAVPDVEELGYDPPVPGHQRGGLVPLPRPRGDRILPVLSRHPPVEREPEPAAGRPGSTAPPGTLRPRRQRIPSRDSLRLTQINHAVTTHSHKPAGSRPTPPRAERRIRPGKRPTPLSTATGTRSIRAPGKPARCTIRRSAMQTPSGSPRTAASGQPGRTQEPGTPNSSGVCRLTHMHADRVGLRPSALSLNG